GPRGFLFRALNLPELPWEYLPQTQALFTHFSGVRLFKPMALSHSTADPPYPVDEAALHHIFDGGWIWVLRFNNGLTSAGSALTPPLAESLRFGEGPAAWQRLL